MVYYDTSENTNAQIEEETKSDEATLENGRESKQLILVYSVCSYFMLFC